MPTIRVPTWLPRVFLHPITILFVLWSGTVLPILSILHLPMMFIGATANAAQRGWRSVAAILLLSPFAVYFSSGVVDYARGKARLRRMGLPSFSFFNIDPVYRIERATGGCVVCGGEWIRHKPYNLAVTMLLKTLGPMPGSYLGPYPSASEAKRALESAVPISAAKLASDVVSLPGRTIRLEQGVGSALLEPCRWGIAIECNDRIAQLEEELGPITAVLYQNRCLIVRIPLDPDLESDSTEESSAMIVLLDARKGRPFAYYREGDSPYLSRYPPVRWLD